MLLLIAYTNSQLPRPQYSLVPIVGSRAVCSLGRSTGKISKIPKSEYDSRRRFALASCDMKRALRYCVCLKVGQLQSGSKVCGGETRTRMCPSHFPKFPYWYFYTSHSLTAHRLCLRIERAAQMAPVAMVPRQPLPGPR